MTKEFDIDAPADMELLAGTFDGKKAEQEAITENPPGEDEEVSDAEDDQDAVTEEAPPADPEPSDKRDKMIPRARFDEVNSRLHAEREESERLRAEIESLRVQPVQSSVNAVDLEKEYFDALMEGDQDKAVAVRSRINAEFVAQAEAKAEERVMAQLSQREAIKALNDTANNSIATYPFLDVNSASANSDAINDVVSWRDMYAAQGKPIHVALQMAVEKVAPMYETAPVAGTVTDKRKQLALVNAAKSAIAQPPRVDAGVGNRAIPVGDAIIGNQDKWEKASDAERLRYLS